VPRPFLHRTIDRRVCDVRGPEWLLANKLGGYASATVRGATRGGHALLVGALPAPLGRIVMLQCAASCSGVHG
jgi:hypothetical protein